MEIIGLITEYNPLHNGHIYQLKKIKELYPNSLLIICLNGYFTERGNISYLTKEDKVKYSLEYGADIVIELPFLGGVLSGDYFAYTGIKLLNELNITTLVFGSSMNEKDLLKIYDITQSKDYNTKLKTYLDQGLSYTASSLKALDINLTANDILGLSYIKAINNINHNINIKTINRLNDYSATDIRNKIDNKQDISLLTPINNFIIPNKDIYYKLLQVSLLNNNLSNIYGIKEGIDKRLIKYLDPNISLDEYIDKVKTKRYSYNEINRLILYIIIGLNKNDIKDLNYDYIKILGFNNNGQHYLNKIKTNMLINKDNIIYKYEIKAAYLYDLINKTNVSLYEKKNQPLKY